MSRGLGKTQIEVLEAVRRIDARGNGDWIAPWQIANELRAMRGLPSKAEIARQRAANNARTEAELAAMLNGTKAQSKEAEELLAVRRAVAMLSQQVGRGQRSDDRGYSASVGLSRVIAKLVERGLLWKDGGRGRAFVRLPL